MTDQKILYGLSGLKDAVKRLAVWKGCTGGGNIKHIYNTGGRMSHISKTKCDGKDCKNEVDHNEPCIPGPTFHGLTFGGSDFMMSFGSDHFDFCSIKCLKEFVAELSDN